MDAALLQQLLTKPTPQKQQEVEIILPKEEGVVDIQTKIVDKTDLGYDGAALRQKLQHFERVHRETNVEEEEIVTVVPPPPSKPSLPDSPKKTAKRAPKTPKAPKAPKASKSISIMV